jgi:nitroimidazol reductase NimA-like FMN-containing flavoprotein (pyridoxamine 5'-phosphate oxidase superfamily)/GNAT superfamily N-acetyltransferase
MVLFNRPPGNHNLGMTFLADPPLTVRSLAETPRTKLKRHAERGDHSREAVDAILDEALVCHVAVVVDGSPRVLPTAHVRVGDAVYLHGARANRLLGAAAAGAPACLTVTLLDGLVFARTWFRHSMNFRSAVLYGRAEEVTDIDEKRAALAALVDHSAPGRSRETRAPTDEELRSTLVLRLPIREGSAKARTGPPLDTPDTLGDECWAGELPLCTTALPPKEDASLRAGTAFSTAVAARARSLSVARAAIREVRDGDLLISTDAERVDFSFVHRFLSEESYWARGIGSEMQQQAMDRSLCFGLYRSAKQIGFARVVTDGGRIAYLADVFVLSEERGKGLGKWLVATLLEHPDLAQVDMWLLGTADAHSLYERFGFVKAEAGRYMVRRQRR